uniref:Uncharacterized protein n=1 Tax=Magnetococcus massalia (strain MO-1) TaxID=451514 RepID=A0A1S7LNV9_MAGMO|nr:Protein of unknown function [Candidatus Magnetococcus massalia]
MLLRLVIKWQMEHHTTQTPLVRSKFIPDHVTTLLQQQPHLIVELIDDFRLLLQLA